MGQEREHAANNFAVALDSATKFDNGKEDWSLMPWFALRPVARVWTYGANKYAAWNFMKGDGMSWSRVSSAAVRHLTAWQEGEDIDQESGQLHLAHLCCCVLMLLAYQLTPRCSKNDDRNKNVWPPKPSGEVNA